MGIKKEIDKTLSQGQLMNFTKMCYLQIQNITFPLEILQVLVIRVLIFRVLSWDITTSFQILPSTLGFSLIIFIIQKERNSLSS